MKLLLLVFLIGVVLFTAKRVLAGDVISPAEAMTRVASGSAVLVDVREPAEWAGGVVQGALLLPLSDLKGDRTRWKPALAAHADKEIILYCRSGNRSAVAARILNGEARKTANAGAFSTWKAEGVPTEIPVR